MKDPIFQGSFIVKLDVSHFLVAGVVKGGLSEPPYLYRGGSWPRRLLRVTQRRSRHAATTKRCGAGGSVLVDESAYFGLLVWDNSEWVTFRFIPFNLFVSAIPLDRSCNSLNPSVEKVHVKTVGKWQLCGCRLTE